MASKIIKRLFSVTNKIHAKPIKQDIKKSGTTEKKSAENKEADKKKKNEQINEDPPIKRVNISLHGASCKAGFAAALLLKQHPLVKKIYMYDTKLNTATAGDLNCVDSSAKVEAYCGDKVSYSLRAADIVVLLDTDNNDHNMRRKFGTSYLRVKKFAHACNLHCPKAIVIVCVSPLCPILCYTQKIIEETPFYTPSKLFGCVTSLQAAINTIVANNLHLDPSSVHVPLSGGPDLETIVPLLSLMSPEPGLSPKDQITFYHHIKELYTKTISNLLRRNSTMNDGYAIGKICIAVAKGLNGHHDALASVFARTSQVFPLRYLVSTVRFGTNGIYHNYGIPKLTSFELQELEKALLKLEKRELYMKKFRHQLEKECKECEKHVCF